MKNRYERIHEILDAAFKPSLLEIVDESAKHAGHAGLKGLPAGETHYQVRMISAALAGQSRVARSRAVHEALDAEFKTGLHALSLKLQTPDEAAL
jgi:stress-induced morphogen